MPTTAGVYNWTITTIGNGDEICPPKISTGSITVHASPTTVVVSGTTPSCDSTILTATNGNDGTIFWQNTTNNGTNTTFPSTTQIVKTNGTYYFRAQSDKDCWSEQGSLAVTINTAPTITPNFMTDTTSRTIVEGGTFPGLAASGESTISISYQWYFNTLKSNSGGTLILGATSQYFSPPNNTPLDEERYYYCVISNTCGNVVSNVSGVHIVMPIVIDENGCNNAIPGWGNSLGIVSFATDNIWVVGNQVWSDAVQATNCNKTTFIVFGNTTMDNISDCRSNPERKGDLFSWCAVTRFKEALCPNPWRVPTRDEFCELDKALNSRDNCDNRNIDEATYQRFSAVWGWSATSYCGPGGHIQAFSGAFYWSQTIFHSFSARYLRIDPTNPHIGLHNFMSVSSGLALRCVRNK
jgi:uncharacterized protein (TIGR02145 family)